MFSQLALSLLCAAVAAAINGVVRPPSKCAPNESEGRFFGEVVTDDGNQVATISLKGDFIASYNQRTEYAETVVQTGETTTVTLKSWKCWNKGLEYEMDVGTGQCKIKRKLSGQMFRGCIGTSEAESVKSFLIGDNKAELLKLAMPDFDSAYMTVLSDSMTPVSLIASSTGGPTSVYTALQYADVKSGINDYSKLTLPASCYALDKNQP